MGHVLPSNFVQLEEKWAHMKEILYSDPNLNRPFQKPNWDNFEALIK